MTRWVCLGRGDSGGWDLNWPVMPRWAARVWPVFRMKANCLPRRVIWVMRLPGS